VELEKPEAAVFRAKLIKIINNLVEISNLVTGEQLGMDDKERFDATEKLEGIRAWLYDGYYRVASEQE